MTFTAQDILAMENPGDLFSDPEAIREEFLNLAIFWHPDRNRAAEAGQVMARITHLYELAKKALLQGYWEGNGITMLRTADGGLKSLRHFSSGEFELGRYYLSESTATFVVEKEHHLLEDNYKKAARSFFFQNRELKERIGACLPVISAAWRLQDGRYGLEVLRPDDAMLLKDVIDHYPEGVPQKHAAWIVSRLLMLCVYLWRSGRTCNGLNVGSCFVSPSRHAVFFLGGWWYAASQNARIDRVPADVFEVMPLEVKESRRASFVTDLESVRMIGRSMFKDPSGAMLAMRGDVHEALALWLNSPCGDDPVEEFESWHECLARAFGPRKFVEMNLGMKTVYPSWK